MEASPRSKLDLGEQRRDEIQIKVLKVDRISRYEHVGKNLIENGVPSEINLMAIRTMSKGDAASHSPPNPDCGENDRDLNLDEDDTPLSPRGERLMKRLTTFVQQTFEQFKHDMGKGKEKVLVDSTKSKSERVSATEFNGLSDPVIAVQWIQNTEKVAIIIWFSSLVT
ncbi:hypothetical protein OSB04_019303 [Centaurea solstitialis]|uniref:Uncharacterized protein n=1 Tax=Centaurea solstitialis TaxID=347529 RepID=A0AA38T2B3_9ASTR|nr:hypothetical protein OSB04_019303 [Centaurea solstitialis]